MGWFTRKKSDVQEKPDLWTVCPACKAHVFKEEWQANLKVCPQCNYHDRLTCSERLNLLIDADSFMEFDADIKPADPLNFSDAKGPYAEKAAQTTAKLKMNESILTGRARMTGRSVVLGIMDFRFLGGSLASGTGEKIFLAADYALRHKLPLIIFSASGGARMHEGILSLMQMAKTCAAIARLHEEKIPYISVMTYPTTGGVSASFAMVGDLNIAEPQALIGFAGRRVIEQTIKQKLPDNFQTAEYMLEHGFVDHIVNRADMKNFLCRVLRYWK